MKKRLFLLLVLALAGFSTAVHSAEARYEIRADGLACPFCAYGIEKKFMKIQGVKHVDFDMKKGLVLVTGEATLELQDAQLKTLFNDAGFTYRKMKKLKCNETS